MILKLSVMGGNEAKRFALQTQALAVLLKQKYC